MLGSKFVKFYMPILKWQINSSSNFESLSIVMIHNSPLNFKLIHFLLWIKGSHQSPNFDTFECSGESLSNSLCRFWKHKLVFLQNLHHSSVPSKIALLYFLSSSIIYFGQKEPIKVLVFEVFECSSQNLLNFSCQFWTNKSIPFQILHHSSLSWHVNPL